VDSFATLAGRVTAELEERGSRFLAIAEPVLDRAGAEAFIARETRAQRNPTHVVPAFRLRDGTEFSSDAGEPAGSAGAPLLAALGGARLHDVAAVVARWYGGTNLGVGGLVRAYGGALARALEGAPRMRCERAAELLVRYRHDQTAAVMRCVHGSGGRDLEHAYREDGVELRFLVPLARWDALAACLRDATRGVVEPERLGESVITSR
jgi:putative IMPACT (imprinted ancient) family translation regulator